MKTNALSGSAILISVAVFLVGCRDETAHSKIQQLETQLEGQRKAFNALVQWSNDRDKQLKEQIAFMAKEIFREYQESFTPVDLAGQGFGIIKSNNGTFLLSCIDAISYLDGHKLVLHIGNPYNMTYSGFKLNAKYGSRPPDFPEDATPEQISDWQERNSRWEQTLLLKEASFTDPLQPGSWTKVEMIFTPSKAKDLAYVSFSMETNQVSLRAAD